MNSRLLCVTLLAAAATALLPYPVSALVEPEHEAHPAPLDRPPLARVDADADARLKASDPWRAAESELGAHWHPRADARTGRLALAWGGTPWITGDGLPEDESKVRERRYHLLSKALGFVQRHEELFGIEAEDLAPSEPRTARVLEGLVWFLSFDYRPHDIPVEGAEVFFRLNRGNLVQVGSNLLLPAGDLDPTPRVQAEVAARSAARGLGEGAVPSERFAPELVWVPVEDSDDGLRYRLAWKLPLDRAGDLATWEARVDAHTGALLELEDVNRYLCSEEAFGVGRITGGVKPRFIMDPEQVRPMPRAQVQTTAEGRKTADEMGLWTHPGGDATSRLQGEYGRVACISCQNPEQPQAPVPPTAEISYGTGGNNAVGNGRSTLAGRTSYYHVARVSWMARQWLNDLPFLADQSFGINVNINAQCNAFFNGVSINMFRRGSQCDNTGENPGVVRHEWGHGLDRATGWGTSSRGEALADHVAWLTAHDPRIGPGFVLDGRPVRQVDENRSSVAVWPNVRASDCGGNSPHCRGVAWGQAGWHFARTLRQQFGESTGYRLYEQLFYAHLFGSNTLDPASGTGTYQAMAVVLDDNGDLSDGIYLGAQFNEAYEHHGLAADPPYADAGLPCDPAPEAVVPIITIEPDAATGRASAALSWSPVPGAGSYRILRNHLGDAENLLEVGEVVSPDTTFTDPGLVQGDTYNYVVMPVLEPGNPFCMATISQFAQVTVDQVQAGLDGIALEGPGGADGVWVPGETIEIRPTIRNLSSTQAADNVAADVRNFSADVAVLDETAQVGDLAPDESLAAGDTWSLELADDQALCGERLTFLTAISADQGCWDDAFSLTVGSGAAQVVLDDLIVDDTGVSGNANGVLEPGETAVITPILFNDGPMDAREVRLSLISLLGTVTVEPSSVDYDTVPVGRPAFPEEGFRVSYPETFPCEISVPFDVEISAANGCWNDFFLLDAVHRDSVVFEDFEDPAGDWSVSGDAAEGGWVQANPINTGLQPGDDTTPAPGILAWVTGNPGGAAEDGDVDGGCTVLTSPVYELGGIPGLSLEYQRFFTQEGDPGDSLLVEASNDAGGSWAEVETVRSTREWRDKSEDLDALFGAPADRFQLRLTACDQDPDSVVEAGVDDVALVRRGCEPPAPNAELAVVRWLADDGIVGGSGDGDGLAEPGETIHLQVGLTNLRNAGATSVEGTLSLDAPPAGAALAPGGDVSAWPDLAPAASRFNEAAPFVLELDPSLACGETVDLRLEVTYRDSGLAPNDPPRSLVATHQLFVGARVPGSGAEVEIFREEPDFDVPREQWIHAELRGRDSWAKGAPLGLEGDPDAGSSGPRVWGTDLGEILQGEPQGGSYDNDTFNFLESFTWDLSSYGTVLLRFQRWLTVEAGDEARILVGDRTAWTSPSDGLVETSWTAQELDVSSLVAGRNDVTVRYELETDGSGTAGGWNLDDIVLVGIPSETVCDVGSCDNVTPPQPVDANLRLGWQDRDAGVPDLRWSGYTGDALEFSLYRSFGDPSALTKTSQVVGRSWPDASAPSAEGVVFYEVRALNPCGIEEAP